MNNNDFQKEVIASNIPVLVDFYAQWCPPCKAMLPIIDEISTNYNGKLKVVKLDVDQATDIAIQYKVRSVPTIIIFKDGKVEKTIIGALSKNKLEQIVKGYI